MDGDRWRYIYIYYFFLGGGGGIGSWKFNSWEGIGAS